MRNTIGAPELAKVWNDPDFSRHNEPSTMPGSSRSRRCGGPRTTRCASASECRPRCRWSTRSAPRP